MSKPAKKTRDADMNREIQRFSGQAFELSKAVADGATDDATKARARELSEQLPEVARSAKELSDAYRPGALKSLSEANLDLAYVASGGRVPSSIRLGWYIKEKAEAGSSDN